MSQLFTVSDDDELITGELTNHGSSCKILNLIFCPLNLKFENSPCPNLEILRLYIQIIFKKRFGNLPAFKSR